MKLNLQLHGIPKSVAVSFIQKHHYSPVMPRLTKHFLGFFHANELVGVLTLGWGTQPRQTIRKMFPNTETRDYYEIGKMCMTDDMPRNSESQMLSLTVKWLKQNCPQVKFLYTMADGIMGKCGYVYQASNFYYGGSYLTQVYMMENGEKLHPRSTKPLLIENAKMEGRAKLFWMTSKFMQQKNIKLINGHMFRYIYPLNKEAKKMMKESPFNWSINYPKDDALKWYDGTVKPKKEIPQPQFVFDNMIYNRAENRRTNEGIEQFIL